jgi:uncharacterized protein
MTTIKGKCSICKKPIVHEFRPFCSKRCQDVDLNRWFSEIYTIPADSAEEQDDQYEDDGV